MSDALEAIMSLHKSAFAVEPPACRLRVSQTLSGPIVSSRKVTQGHYRIPWINLAKANCLNMETAASVALVNGVVTWIRTAAEEQMKS